jgi:transposase
MTAARATPPAPRRLARIALSIEGKACSMTAMQKRYIVNLTDEERVALEAIVRGRSAVQKRQRARILLRADEGLTDAEIAEEVESSHRTVERVRQRCCTEGLNAAIEPKQRALPPRAPKLDGAAEARLVHLACSEPPDGRAKWTLSLLADKLVELEVVDSVSRSTICRRLKKTH